MASQRRKRKASTKRWAPPKDPTLFLWTLFGVHFAVGLLWSPITSLTVLRAEGVPGFDRERVRQAVQFVKDVPRLQTNPDQIRSLILGHNEVESVAYRANLFGRGVMVVKYKKPVGVIDEERGVMLSSNGQVFTTPTKVNGLPIVVPPQSPMGHNLSIVGAWRSREAAALCAAVVAKLPNLHWRVGVSKNGFVSLFPAAGAKVELGSFDGAEKKVEALAKILKDDPNLLSKVSKLTLYSPENPLVEP